MTDLNPLKTDTSSTSGSDIKGSARPSRIQAILSTLLYQVAFETMVKPKKEPKKKTPKPRRKKKSRTRAARVAKPSPAPAPAPAPAMPVSVPVPVPEPETVAPCTPVAKNIEPDEAIIADEPKATEPQPAPEPERDVSRPWRKFAIDAAARRAKAEAEQPQHSFAATAAVVGKIYPAQAFDPQVNPQNPSWAAYRPRWLCDAEQPVHVTPESFKRLRTLLMYMSIEQCAAFLRVAPETVEAWESGQTEIPCAAYLALRLVGDVQFLPHQVKEWADWKIIPAGVDVGMLFNMRSGEMFSPQEVASLRYVRNKSEILERERHRLQKQVSDLEAENTRLRAMFLSQGVTKELHAMQDRLSNLITSINTAQVIDIAPTARLALQPKESAA